MAPEARPPTGVRVIHIDTLNVVGMFHDLQLSISKGEPTLEFLVTGLRLVRQESSKLPGGMGLVVVVNAGAKPPSDEAKEHLKRSYAEGSAMLRAMVRVVEGEGFSAAAKRSVLSFIDLVLRPKCPSKVVGRVDEGVGWIVQHMTSFQNRQYAAADVLRALRELRAALEASSG